MKSGLAPLRVGGYARLLASYAVNQLGDSFALIALSVLVYDRSGSAVATAGLFLAAKFLPALAAPALTARLDQYRVNRVLAGLYAAEAVIFAGLALLAINYVYAAVLVLAMVDGVLALTARAISRAAAAEILTPAGLLRDGNALMNVAFGVAMVVGTLLGGVVVAAVGPDVGLAIDAGSFAVVAFVVFGLRALRPEHAPREPVMQRVRDGLRHVRSHPLLPLLLTGQALALVCFYLVIPIEVVYAKDTLGVGDAGFGLLLGAWSAGILVGSLAYVRLSARSPMLLVLIASALIGAAYVGMAAAEALWVACVLSVAGGIGNGFQWVSVMTMLQEATPAHLQARVVGLLESVGAAMPGIGFVLGGALAAIWSPRAAYAVAGVGVLAVVMIGAVLLPRRYRLTPRPLPAAPSADA